MSKSLHEVSTSGDVGPVDYSSRSVWWRVGAVLLTRDGRRIGNAVSLGRPRQPANASATDDGLRILGLEDREEVIVIATDLGELLFKSPRELNDLFYWPTQTLDVSNHAGAAVVLGKPLPPHPPGPMASF